MKFTKLQKIESLVNEVLADEEENIIIEINRTKREIDLYTNKNMSIKDMNNIYNSFFHGTALDVNIDKVNGRMAKIKIKG
jgi:CRISPR/Cas system-associated endoribonuclease Cas2